LCSLEDSLRDERGESARLRHLAYTDWLTALHNHSHSRHLLAAALASAKASGAPLCVIMADLDQFKRINDRYGHLVGDEVLRIAASRMLSAARSGTQIGRYGGEEFLMVLPKADLATAREVAERVRQRVSRDAIHCDEARISVSISLGIAQARRDDSVNSLIERADAALYAAKLDGRDCVRVESRERRTRADLFGLQKTNA
jgi:diguanylate cyclase (GGDEF)-like protein